MRDRPVRPRSVPTALAALLALGASGTHAAAPAAKAEPLAGTYRLRVTGQVRASPLVDEEVDEEVEADLSEVARDGRVDVKLAAERYSCEIRARLSAVGEISFDPQQRCTLVVAEPTARGRVEARLESGRGRLQGGRLEVETTWALSGSVSVLAGGQTYEVLGREVELPATWMPEVPLRGSARARASGRRIEARGGR